VITIAAEIGMAHDGDWRKVEAYAKAAKACGVDVLKLQCHLPEESSELEQWRVDPGTGESRQQYWARTAWDLETWRKVGWMIYDHGLQFGCSVFSLEAIELLKQVPTLGVWKVPSGVSEWRQLVAAVPRDGRPVWISDGLSEHGSVGRDSSDVWMHCVSLYPCSPELSGLGHLRDEIWTTVDANGSRGSTNPYPYGWSDHTGDPALIYAAVGAGATVVEVHFELGYGSTPDTLASWDEDRLDYLVQGIRRIEQGLASTDKDAIAAATAHLRPYYVPTRLNGRIAKHHGEGEPI
jgi:sialic acid synthase SpsE